jgi:hypothetical protein
MPLKQENSKLKNLKGLCWRHDMFLFLFKMPQTSIQLLEVVMACAYNILNVLLGGRKRFQV